MTSRAEVFINDKGKPANIPSYETIIRKCPELRRSQTTAINVSGVRITLEKKSNLDASDIWVKSGYSITMGEALTQRFVAQYLEDNNITAVRAPRVYVAFTWCSIGYIVTEYIDGKMCENSDTDLIAAAVRVLIDIPSPSSTPGPIGGGLIEHPFFVDRRSSIKYESVKDLEDHVNGILSYTGRRNRVNFSDEVANYGLRLCPSDLKFVNFMRDSDGKMVAVDFDGYSFLPPSFFAFALEDGNLAHRIWTILKYPDSLSTNVGAMMTASCALAPYGSNNVGE
ncbi:hypothetical protein CTheo_6488 [Ceratobasidium theobromae]|uniref:Aminoglycoside phosphotransferase domain-containing protein n=1 Tax=Ceratobasidium theobromae TaxID=1582974 RepID=A0A5N5QF39_9AGAM|nr:hypothetical protein CTheo_6488 [Ceratobasidium theobromae]